MKKTMIRYVLHVSIEVEHDAEILTDKILEDITDRCMQCDEEEILGDLLDRLIPYDDGLEFLSVNVEVERQ